MNFRAKFKWAILKIEAKLILLLLFGHISSILVRLKNLKKNRVTAEDLLYHSITLLADFGALGA